MNRRRSRERSRWRSRERSRWSLRERPRWRSRERDLRGTRFDLGRRNARRIGECRREPIPFSRVSPSIRGAEGIPSYHQRSRAISRAQAPSRSWADRVLETVPVFPLSGRSQCSQAEASHRQHGISRESQREPQRESQKPRQKHVREEREVPTADDSRKFPVTRAQSPGNRHHLMSRHMDNNAEAGRDVNEDGWKVVHRRRRQSVHRKAMDPVQEGACFRCLSQNHYARSCVSPIRCRFCRREGHRQAQCPLKVQGSEEEQGREIRNLSSCLVGETRGGCTPTLDQTIIGLQERVPNLIQPDCHVLASGDFFLKGLSRDDWNALRGWKQQCPGQGAVYWRRPNSEDGSLHTVTESCFLELRGIPFQTRTWRFLKSLLYPVGDIIKIISDGVRSGNPNGIRVELRKKAGRPIPATLPARVGGSEVMITVFHLVWSPIPQSGSHKRSECKESESAARQIASEARPPSPCMYSPCQPGTNLVQPICPVELTKAVSTKEDSRAVDPLPKVNITYRRHYQSAPPRPRRGKMGAHSTADRTEQMGALSSDGAPIADSIAYTEVIGSNMGAAHEALLGVIQGY